MRVSPLSPEPRLLFLTAGVQGDDEEIAEIASQSVDWPRLTLLAVRARATPVVSRRIARALGGRLPAAAMPMARLAMVEEFELARMEERLDQTMDAFEGAGVPAVLLKGAALARSVFPSFHERPMLDLDVLLRADDVERARAAALSAGWLWRHQPRYAPFFSKHHHLPPLVDGRGTRALLELHTGLYPYGHPFASDEDVIIERSVMTARGNRVYRVLEPEDHLVYLSTHWVWSHMMNGGAWRAFRDVSAFVETRAICWHTVVERARALRALTCVYWTLRLARTLSGVPVPRDVLLQLRPPTPQSVLSRLERYFLTQLGGELRCPSERLGEFLWAAAMRPGWSGHGTSRPWKNPEGAIWMTPENVKAPTSRRFAETFQFALTVARL
jgi:hypothetical protein